MWTYNYTNELCHDGVKGMHWGQRLYQNKDGSLTPLGRLRYRKMRKDKSKQLEPETSEQKKARILSSPSAKDVYENRHLFSNKEINDLYLRLNNEKNIKGLITPEVNRGKKFIDTIDMASKSIKTVIDSSDSIYESVMKGKKLLEKLQKTAEEKAK